MQHLCLRLQQRFSPIHCPREGKKVPFHQFRCRQLCRSFRPCTWLPSAIHQALIMVEEHRIFHTHTVPWNNSAGHVSRVRSHCHRVMIISTCAGCMSICNVSHKSKRRKERWHKISITMVSRVVDTDKSFGDSHWKCGVSHAKWKRAQREQHQRD